MPVKRVPENNHSELGVTLLLTRRVLERLEASPLWPDFMTLDKHSRMRVVLAHRAAREGALDEQSGLSVEEAAHIFDGLAQVVAHFRAFEAEQRSQSVAV